VGRRVRVKAYAGCFLAISIIAIVLALVLGAALDVGADARDTVFLPAVASSYRECRLVLYEDNSWYSPDYSPSEGFPPDPPCVWVFEEGDCD
jgi:hypothetical protein